MKSLALLLIRSYQLFISPLFGPSCRFYPTCSQYAVEAIERHGFFKGGFLAVRRVLRCHPFAKGGVDLVPGSSEETHSHECCCHSHEKEISNDTLKNPNTHQSNPIDS